MVTKKKARPATQANVTPDYITYAERLAHKVCARLGTTPQRAADSLNDNLSPHLGKGLYAAQHSRVWREPWIAIIAAGSQGKLNAEIAEEQLAAVLWLGAQDAKTLLRKPNCNAAVLSDLSWRLSLVSTALRFPELRAQILQDVQPDIERGKKNVESSSRGGKARAAMFEQEKKVWKAEDKKLREDKPHLSKRCRAMRIAEIYGGKVETIRKNI